MPLWAQDLPFLGEVGLNPPKRLRVDFRKKPSPGEANALKLMGITDRTKGPLYYPRGMERAYGCVEIVWCPWDNIETPFSGFFFAFIF